MRSFISLRPGSRFGTVYRSGRRVRSGGITVLQTPGQSVMPEVGVVAGKNVGNAVKRNRAKRRLREAAQSAGFRPKMAYVVVASPDVLDAPFAKLAEWLNTAVVDGGRITDRDGE